MKRVSEFQIKPFSFMITVMLIGHAVKIAVHVNVKKKARIIIIVCFEVDPCDPLKGQLISTKQIGYRGGMQLHRHIRMYDRRTQSYR